MGQIDVKSSVGQLVVENPAWAPILEQYGIDYCCGGKKSLERACAERSVEPSAVVKSLMEKDASGQREDEKDWTRAGLGELADHITHTHHDYLKAELPRLSLLVNKMARVHGEHHPELEEVARVFDDFQADMEAHMMKEERVLFPMCKELEAADHRPIFHCGSLGNPIRVMEAEHEAAGHALEQMRVLTAGFTPPADACNTYRVMLAGLFQVEADTHQHVHKENNILFPRAAALEASLPA